MKYVDFFISQFIRKIHSYRVTYTEKDVHSTPMPLIFLYDHMMRLDFFQNNAIMNDTHDVV